jgi:hypothetical protein
MLWIANDSGGELGGGQLLDLAAVDRTVEVPIEVGQGFGFAEACLADAMRDAAFAAQVGLGWYSSSNPGPPLGPKSSSKTGPPRCLLDLEQANSSRFGEECG